MFLKVWRFIALMLAALTLGLGFCHLMQLPARMAWDQYLWVGSTVQGGLYAWFGSVGAMIFVTAVIVLALNAYFVKEHGRPGSRLAVFAALLFALALLLWWVLVYPVNVELAKWVNGPVPEDWTRWRASWEWGHATIAIGGVLGLCALGRLGAGGHAATEARPQAEPAEAPRPRRAARPKPKRRPRRRARGAASAHIWMARLSAASAASFTASFSVGCAWQVRAKSSAEPPNSISTAASAIMVPASAPRICTPSTRSVAASASTLTKPSVVRLTLARPLAVKGNLPTLISDARVLQLLLGLAHARHFRRGVDHARDHVVIHVARLAGEDLGHCHAFLLGLVREHGALDHVADGVDAGDIRGVMGIDEDASAIVGLHAELGEPQPLRVGHAADADEHHVAVQRFLLAAACGLDRDFARLALGLDARAPSCRA